MCSKWIINVGLASVWGTFEYFTQFGPLGRMSYLWWLFFGITMWYGTFWLIDVVEGQIKPKIQTKPQGGPARIGLQRLMSWVLRVYLWIPLLLLAYFLFHYFDTVKISMFFLWEVKIVIGTIIMFKSRKYLVQRYCVNKQDVTTKHIAPKI